MIGKKKKILFVITKGNFGGAQKYVYDLATHLSVDKFDIVVASGVGHGLLEKLDQKNIRNIRIVHSERDLSLIKDILLFFEILKIFKKEKPDIIHLNSSKMGLLGSVAASFFNLFKPKKLKIKIIFTAHGWAFNDKKIHLKKRITKFFQWLTVTLTDKTIAVSQKTCNDILSLTLINKKIIVIYNGIESFDFLEKETARKKILASQSEKFWIGTVAELHKNKGIDILISAATNIRRDFPKAVFVILGEGEERKTLQKKIEKENLKDVVFLLGNVPEAAIFLKAFDIFTLTSRTEGLPYALLEAGLAGLPTIATNVGGIPEVLDTDNGILIEKENTNDAIQKIQELIENEEKRRQLGENLKEKIQKNFSLKEMVEKTAALYLN